jgi:putative membrane protein
MKNIIKIIKGSLVGMGSILPGISGSMVATILKIYQDLITALNNFTKNPIKAVLSVWQYIVGVILGYIIGFFFISTFLGLAPLPFTLLFIGFILGAVPSLKKETETDHYHWHHFLVLGIAMVSMVGFMFIQESSAASGSGFYYVVVFMIGVITAISLIIPGLSGATMLMAFGYFQTLITLGDDLIAAIISFDFSQVVSQLPMLLVLVLGVLVGMIVMGKVMFQLLKHYKIHFYFAVLGIVLVSPFNILFTLQAETTADVFQASWYVWVIGILLFILGAFISYSLSKKDIKSEAKP